jgi:cyanophycinase-like exopeptidase
LIYLLGGFPRYLGETLHESRVWESALAAYQDGAVVGGSSAGAMVLCGHYYDPHENKLLSGLNLLPNCCILPHHNNFSKRWVPQLSQLLPQAILIGIDEQTGILNDASGRWTVYGAGDVTLYRSGQQPKVHMRGESFTLIENQA